MNGESNAMPSNNKRLTLRSHEAKTLEKASFLTLPIRTTNNWNKECLRGVGELRGQNALFKIAMKQCLGHLKLTLDFVAYLCVCVGGRARMLYSR